MVDSVENKAVLRRTILGKRDAMEDGARTTLSRVIIRKIIDLSAYGRSKVVLAYTTFGSELQTDDFLRSVLDQGKMLVLPRVNRARESLDLYEVEDLTRDLEAGVWGIREPRTARCKPVEIDDVDFVLVPGVVFDVWGGRLGYGGGFYDKLLCSSIKRPQLVAGAFETQVVDEIPLENHDALIDLVVTESGFYPPTGEEPLADPS